MFKSIREYLTIYDFIIHGAKKNASLKVFDDMIVSYIEKIKNIEIGIS